MFLCLSKDLPTAVFKGCENVKVPLMITFRDILAVLQDYLLLSNSSQAKVQLVDTRDGRVVSEVSMPYLIRKPIIRRLSLLRYDQAAVAVSNKVQTINIEGQNLTLGTALNLKGDPVGVSTCGKSDLVVSYCKAPWLEVISTDGKPLHQFDEKGTSQHFKLPKFLTTSIDGYVFVSDRGTNTITKMNTSLQLLQTFSSALLTSSRGIISISPDQLLVCSDLNHCIVLLNTNTGTLSTILGEEDGLQYPCSLSYRPEQRKLYVLCCNALGTRSVKIFELI